MKLYKINIKPDGAFISKLQSDTFFGAFCWSYRYLYGEDMLGEFLEKCKSNEISLVFSNAYPKDCLPLPLGIRYNPTEDKASMSKEELKVAYQKNKKYKKRRLVSIEAFKEIQKGNQTNSILAEGTSEQKEITIENIHNTVSRELGTVTEKIDGGGLFSIEECNTSNTYDVYVLSDIEKETLSIVLKTMFELGIGARKSVGRGRFIVVEDLVDVSELLTIQDANGFVTLSNYIPARSDPNNGMYKTFVKNGKMDREYANTDFPFKKPLLFIQAGALFGVSNPYMVYGRFITDVAVNEKIVINAKTIALPIKYNNY